MSNTEGGGWSTQVRICSMQKVLEKSTKEALLACPGAQGASHLLLCFLNVASLLSVTSLSPILEGRGGTHL